MRRAREVDARSGGARTSSGKTPRSFRFDAAGKGLRDSCPYLTAVGRKRPGSVIPGSRGPRDTGGGGAVTPAGW